MGDAGIVGIMKRAATTNFIDFIDTIGTGDSAG
jgi:hypothetical protein